VTTEDVAKTVAQAQRTYLDSLVMYGMRKENLLQATFQVSRFVPGANYSSDKFRLTIVDEIGTQLPISVIVGGQPVYLTSGDRQHIAIWFKGPYLFVLATRQDYMTARDLLRQLLTVGP
jgi:hypothetical protein